MADSSTIRPGRGRASALRIIVTGLVAQHCQLAGVTWDYVQYAAGLARLGHDVYYFEDSGEWPYNLAWGPSGNDRLAADCTSNVQHLADVMERFGLKDRWAYRHPAALTWFGLTDRVRQEVRDSADLLINVSGTVWHPEENRRIKRLAYIDSDPGFSQVKILTSSEFKDRVDAHDVHFSFGESMSTAVPATGYDWKPTRQPIVLSEWSGETAHRNTFTTVMSWTSYRPLRHDGRTYAQKDVELQRFLALPARVQATMEIALSNVHHVAWELTGAGPSGTPGSPALAPRDVLAEAGWQVVDPQIACAGVDAYRRYIESSKAEWSVAKHGYVQAQSGWFSCRSACYLAAGRPVVVQDTGFSRVLPVGEGLLTFSSLDDAAAAVEAVEADYVRHANAARAIADEYFDSDAVLSRFIDTAFATEPRRPRREAVA